MKVNVLGTRAVNFTNNNGETVKGTSIWLSWALTGENASGQESEKFFIAEGGAIQAPSLKVGQEYTAGFNNKGKLVSLTTETKTFTAVKA